MNNSQFDKEYYERGVEAGVSGYQNYRWMPERVFPFANYLKQLVGTSSLRPRLPTALDFGCAKGFLVKALRLLGVDARGYDISEYAIQNCDPAVKDFVSATPDGLGLRDLVVSKDTLEHIPYDKIQFIMNQLSILTGEVCVIVVPLGNGKTYRIREYELDKTHVIREDEEWWINVCKKSDFKIKSFSYDCPAKEHWKQVHPYGNMMLVLEP